MINRSFLVSSVSFFLVCVEILSFNPLSAWGNTEDNIGIQPLQQRKEQSIQELLPPFVSPLFGPQEIEHFLERLEGNPPNWTQQHHTDITEQSERLFQLNRLRDAARLSKNEMLAQPIAFLWTGTLRQYLPEYQGFSLALGPVHTHTSWGTIRFKVLNLPDFLIGTATPDIQKELLARQKLGEHIEIAIVCIGTLIPEESVIYAFSHDTPQEGMILPVVSVQRLLYVLEIP